MRLAERLYERAIFNGEYDGLTDADRVLDAAEAELLIARGRIMHGRFLDSRVEHPGELPAFERAAELYREVGDERGEGEAQFWIGCFHQVVPDWKLEPHGRVPMSSSLLLSKPGIEPSALTCHRDPRVDDVREDRLCACGVQFAY